MECYQPKNPCKYSLNASEYSEHTYKEKKQSKPVKFIAVDGEGYTSGDSHIFNLLGASDGSFISNNWGLTTSACFDYLLNLQQENPSAVLVGFYFSYDTNMICRDLPPNTVSRLATYGHAFAYTGRGQGHCYRIEYLPRKLLMIAEGFQAIINGVRKFCTIRRVKIWDVFGFFQSSFVGAVRKFGIATESELSLLDTMKGERGNFTDDMITEIKEYNLLECKLLVTLMEKLQTALISASIYLRKWHGAGAIASYLLGKHKVKDHIQTPSDSHLQPVLHSYFGGRVQALQIGEYDTVHTHDIISAYPATTLDLPSLTDCKEYTVNQWNPSLPYTIWHIRYRFPDNTLLCPFPFRSKDGGIYYPLSGEGYHWSSEVLAAMEYYPECIEVIKGYVFEPSTDEKPFAFVQSLFNDRERFKREGNHAQYAVKLGLNSLYGKTAQGIGTGGNKPPFQSYIWAGLITADTRSKMFRLSMNNPESVIAFATDGILSTSPLCPPSAGLGGYECDSFEEFFNIKPGFYWGRKGDKITSKVRGFRASEIRYNELRAEWKKNGIAGRIVTPSRRFIGMKSDKSLMTWCQWIDGERACKFMPDRGIPSCINLEPLRFRILPMDSPQEVSYPYTPKTSPDEPIDGIIYTIDESPDIDG